MTEQTPQVPPTPLWELTPQELKANVFYTYYVKILGRLYDGSEISQNRSHRFEGLARGPNTREEWKKIVHQLTKGDFEVLHDFEVLESESVTMVNTVQLWENEHSENLYMDEDS